MRMEANFSISLSFLLNHYLNIYFERELEAENKAANYALREFSQKFKDLSDEDAEQELDKYFSLILPESSEVPLTPESLNDMSKWMFEEHMKTDKYLVNLLAGKLLYTDSYVFDKNTEEMIECGKGEHKMAIFKLCAKYLSRKYPEEFNGDYFSINEKYFDELDEYITESLVINGEYFGVGSYSSFQKIGVNRMIIE